MGSQNVWMSCFAPSSLFPFRCKRRLAERGHRLRVATSMLWKVTVTRLFLASLVSCSPVSFTTESELKADVGMQELCGLSLMLMPLPQPHRPIFQWETLQFNCKASHHLFWILGTEVEKA